MHIFEYESMIINTFFKNDMMICEDLIPVSNNY